MSQSKENNRGVQTNIDGVSCNRPFCGSSMGSIYENLLEVKGQISGDDADVKQVLHVLKLALLEVAEYVQGLQQTVKVVKMCPTSCIEVWLYLLSKMCHTSSPMSVLLYSKWCLSMMEEPWSLARGCWLLHKKDKYIFTHRLHTHASTFYTHNTLFWLALSGRGCWSLCGRYRGRKQQPPWRRHLDQSSTSSASLSVGRGDESWIIMCRCYRLCPPIKLIMYPEQDENTISQLSHLIWYVCFRPFKSRNTLVPIHTNCIIFDDLISL